MRFSSFCLCVTCALTAHWVQAADQGKITFTGLVVGQTCTVAIDGSKDMTIKLDDVHVSAFAGKAKTRANKKAFQMNFSECSIPAKPRTLKVTLAANKLTESGGYLDNEVGEGAATGVALQLLKGGSSPDTAFDFTPGLNFVDVELKENTTAASLDFAVQYVSTDSNVTPGSVQSTVQYTLSYH